MSNILVTGPDNLLASYLAVLSLTSSNNSVLYMLQGADEFLAGEVTDFLCRTGRQIAGGNADEIEKQIKSRFHTATVNRNYEDVELPHVIPDIPHVDEVWYFAGESCATDTMNGIVAALPKFGASQFNYVCSAYIGKSEATGKSKASNAERDMIRDCQAHNIDYRIFRTSLIVAASWLLPAAPQHDFLQFVTALHELKTEIEKRLPDYFDFQSLRCLAINTPLNLVRAYDAAELMLRIARQDGTASREYQISSPKSNLFSDLCERLGMLYGLSLLPVDDIQELNAIDQVFHARVAALHAHLESSELLDDKDVYRIAGIVPDHAVIDDEEQVNLFEAIRRNQDAIEAASNQRIANLHAILTKKTINRDGFELTYYVSGSKGPPVVILNALGQGLNLWYPLMDKLMRRHCVIIWEPRGIFSPPPPFRLGDQVDDLDAVLQQESVNQCHLVCWCTGPKVAVEFYLRRPAVASSMVFLNSTFSYPKGPQAIQELDSDYGRNHAALCGALDAAPTMAGSVMRALQSISAGAEVNPFEADNKQFATTVLSLISLDLKPHILAPFQNESATLNYARQVLDFLSYDALSKAEQVKVPVLFLGGEFDTVASPAMARAAARFFPTVRYLQAQGATHYCIYDRPELIARVIEGFFSNPAEAYPPCSEVSELA